MSVDAKDKCLGLWHLENTTYYCVYASYIFYDCLWKNLHKYLQSSHDTYNGVFFLSDS